MGQVFNLRAGLKTGAARKLMITVHYRQWRPPQSPLRIEFPPDLLHDVRRHGWQEDRRVPQSSGILFGVQRGSEVRLLAAGCDGEDHGDLTPLGTFVCRERGEVFLTEDDLASFEEHSGIVALVVAGGRAGFFVREPDGSVQAIRSHEEFRVADAAPMPVSSGPTAVELPAPPPRAGPAWKRALACAGLLAIPAAGFAYFQPLLPRLPIALSLREEAGQLLIGWNPKAVSEVSRLEIQDGGDRTVLMLEPNTSSAAYRLRTSEAEVRLSTESRTGGARWEAARFLTKAPRKPAADTLQDRIQSLTLETEELRRSLSEKRSRTEALAAKIAAIARPAP